MQATLQQAKRFAQLKGTKVFDTPGGYKIHDDGSITFVLLSGPKLTFTGDELAAELAAMEKANAKAQAILDIREEDEPKPKIKPRKEQPAAQKE